MQLSQGPSRQCVAFMLAPTARAASPTGLCFSGNSAASSTVSCQLSASRIAQPPMLLPALDMGVDVECAGRRC